MTDVLSDANLQRLASFRYAHISVRRTQKPAETSDSNPILNLSQPANGENNLTPAPQASWSCTLQPRWAPKLSSQWDVLKDQVIRSHPPGICTLFYAFPYMSPGFMAINYLVCGPRTDYTTLRICLEIATEIARARGCQAIVCQAFSELLNERLMKRCDFVPHAKNLGPNHYIRRLAPRLSC